MLLNHMEDCSGTIGGAFRTFFIEPPEAEHVLSVLDGDLDYELV